MRPCQCAAPRRGVGVRWGGGGGVGAGGGGPPSTGSGRTDLGSGPTTGCRGCDGGGDAPRRAPLDTGFRRYDDGGVRGPPSTGSGRTDLGSAPATGSWGCDGGWRRPAPRPSGYRLSPVRRWGCAGRQVLAVMEGRGGPAAAGRALREAPLRRSVAGRECGSVCRGLWWGGPRPAPAPPRGACGLPFTLRFPSGRTASPAPQGTLVLGSCLCRNHAWGCPARRPSGFLPSQE